MTTATQQTAAPSLDAILTAPAVVVPGIARWLGYTDDQQPLDEDFEDYCNRISKAGA